MRSRYLTFILLIVVAFLIGIGNAQAQPDTTKNHMFSKTAYGYFNDELTIAGDVLEASLGVQLKNNYTLSLNYKFAETINDKGTFPGIAHAELIYTEKIVTFFMGYNFTSKNSRHTFLPELGPFYSTENIQYINYDTNGDLFVLKRSFEDIGFGLELNYLYNFKFNLSVGISCSGYLAYIMGPLYYTVAPVVVVRY